MQKLVIYMDSMGIGDAILCSAIVTGAKMAFPDYEIFYRVQPHHMQWMSMYKDVKVITEKMDGAVELNPYSSYGHEVSSRSADPRLDYYSRECLNVTPVKPTWSVSKSDLEWAKNWENHVVICPFSFWQNRNYPVQNWLTLERLLIKKGESVVIVDAPGDGSKTERFNGFRFWGIEPTKVAALIKVSKLTIANDSGMAHLGGALDVNTIAICGPTNGKKIFGFWETVNPINGKLPCDSCYWSHEFFYPECNSSCINMSTITPQELLELKFVKKNKKLFI